MKKINCKNTLMILILGFCCCFLTGCPSPADESKQAEEYVKQAIPMAEKALDRAYPDAVPDRRSFHGIDGVKVGPDHELTDWVEGQYKNGGIYDILINVKTQEIYTTDEQIKVSIYAMKRAFELYNADLSNMQGSVDWSFEVPYCYDSDKYGNMTISNMLPINTVADDKFIDELLNDKKYHKTYNLIVGEDFDMSIFKETEFGMLGDNVRVYAEQHSYEYFELISKYGVTPESETDEPIAIFDSDSDNRKTSE